MAEKFCLNGWLLVGLFALNAHAQPFRLPTANNNIFKPGAEEKFFAATPGNTWSSGSFGCVRNGGWKIHEGLDIRSLQADKRGEPTDPVCATTDGDVVYINTRAGLSSFGNYIIVRHLIEGMEIYSFYAHLSHIEPGIKAGLFVKSGQVIATMGRTSSATTIGKDRAHVHFELNLLVNDRFSAWFKKNCPGERNDHGDWNGQNFIGLDPRLILLEEQKLGAKFSLLEFIRRQTELCRVAVRATNFPWVRRYPELVRRNPVAEKEGVAGYEIAFNFNALPFELIPRASSELKSKAAVQLISVNAVEQQKNPARRLVSESKGHWILTDHGMRAVGLLVY